MITCTITRQTARSLIQTSTLAARVGDTPNSANYLAGDWHTARRSLTANLRALPLGPTMVLAGQGEMPDMGETFDLSLTEEEHSVIDVALVEMSRRGWT